MSDKIPLATSSPPQDDHVGVAQRMVAVHTDHRAAQESVAVLDDAGLPAERIAIVGSGLRVVERGQGRLSTADVAGRGAVSGLVVGMLVGWLLSLVGLTTPETSAIWLAVNAGVLGAILGAVVALVGYVATRGNRTFVQPAQIQAEKFGVLVDADLADRAVRALRSSAGD
ncbi:general stress protein [Paractinoplanes atraurantiacus]|uniref:General stress protein 17M-like domain-containing protein n=1 Tax=Paractinoplanes atraurantiacus TaxID=1036182 RepID=A0A285GTJ6_9ACTN|nr:general stress protein [Actinoplanes atraurantiacus]SNY25641.1 hypothetical protein SAMN05421748_102380 [Actinoplanes atraurantiacus]